MAFSQPSDFSPSRRRSSGFTLVEVTLALGIVAFAFIALLALLPAGNVAFRRAIDLAVCSQIAQRVIADAQNADFDTLTLARTGSGVVDGHTFPLQMRYFDDQGREIVPQIPKSPTNLEIARAVYWVNSRVMQVAQVPRNSSRTTRTPDFRYGEVIPLNAMAQITVQVVHNPNLLPLKLSASDPDDKTKADRSLVPDSNASKIKLDILTYSAMVSRN